MYLGKIDTSKPLTLNRVIKTAKQWVGAPYHHQGMVKHVGADCVGTVVGVGLECEALDVSKDEIKSFGGYARTPNPKIMGRHIRRFLKPVENPSVGDIVWIHWKEGLPMHLAILSIKNDKITLIHAASEFKKVVEQEYNAQWRRQTDSFWRYPGVID